MNLNTSIEKIRGVGPRYYKQFEDAGLKTIEDLVFFLPRRYEDFSKISKICNLRPGKVTLKARCETVENKSVKRGITLTTATIFDDTGKVKAVWFNQPYRKVQIEKGDEFFFSGEFDFKYNSYQLKSPSVERVSSVPIQTDRLLPIYRGIRGLKSQLVRKVIAEIKPFLHLVPESLPESIIKAEKLLSRSEALLGIHFPKDFSDFEKAKERFAYEELFQLLLASQLNKNENTKLKGWHIPFDKSIVSGFVKKLPFELTGAQKRAAWDIIQDFERKTPMNRLLQGDVGSGKTVVAGLAACSCAGAGYQTAILAPTEILASQHAETLERILSPLGYRVGLLTGGVKGTKRKALYEDIANGNIHVVVGTHAIIQDSVVFHKLGFAVIDEQHRFGVKQRQQLLSKSKHLPHLLAMTATPIPRSLALTVYGELDISIVNEMPKGRKEIKTKIWSPNSRAQLYEEIEKELIKGRQAYVICNLIDENPDNELRSVNDEHKKLRNSVFKHRKIGLLHGKMKSDEKNKVMLDFLSHELDILVSTTVVEVGVDVPNATVILIEDADRFGLSQLHQLRGRVGRSDHQSYCYLVNSDSSRPSQRLREIEKTNDGFYLAEVDLKMRGPGEIYGSAQHGALNLQIATLSDTSLIARAQRQAKIFVNNSEDLVQYKELERKVEQYQKLTTLN